MLSAIWVMMESRLRQKNLADIMLCIIIHRGYLVFFFFPVKDRNSFHRVDTIGNTFTSGAATSENITDGVHEMK